MVRMRGTAGAWVALAALWAAACGGDGGGGGAAGSGGGGGGTGGVGGGGGGGGDPFAVDECAAGTHECAPEADCIDTPGFYECACRAGYQGDGRSCEDIDECAALLDDCDPAAVCTNTPGTFTCACPPGMAGDGRSCDSEWTAVSAGQYHACAIRVDRSLWCWGHNTSGQVGTGTTDPVYLRPAAAGSASDWTAVSAGGSFTCALNDTGRILCWGTNSLGQLGDGTTTGRANPTLVTGGVTEWTALDVGATHACAIRQGGALSCWGSNNRGQVGDNTTENRTQPTPVGADAWIAVSAGSEFTCAVRADHTLWCWGLNTSRQLGDNTSVTSRATPAQEATLAADWASVSAGNGYACGVKQDGTRWCWGTNTLGQAGNGAPSTTVIAQPQVADMETDWVALDAGDLAACARRADGSLRCWGDGSLGQTGQPGAEGPLGSPAQVGADTDWLSVTSGLRFACGIQQGGRLSCWGSASRGALGIGSSSDRAEPTPVGADTDWTRVDVQLDDGCGIRGTGDLYCWGRNVYGHLGDGTTLTRVAPAQVAAGKTWKRVALGRTHTCGIADEGGVDVPLCWGWDNNGELGNGAGVTNQLTPAPVVVPGGGAPWIAIAAGYNHTCAVRQDGTLWCWGRNASGQLGDGTTTARAQPTQALPAGATDWIDVAAAGDFTCGLRATGALFCWGVNNNAQLGLGHTNTPVSTPTQVGADAYAALDVSANHGCAVTAGGALRCWGRNANGELGLGNSVGPVLAPAAVGADTDWVRPFLGQGLSTCALKASGALYCWGLGSYGQLGLDSLTSFTTPQLVPSVEPWQSASLGNEHACGVSAGGRLLCWGASNYAQLGGGLPFLATPAGVLDPE